MDSNIYFISFDTNLNDKAPFVYELPSSIYQSNSSPPKELKLHSCTIQGRAEPPDEEGEIQLALFCNEVEANFHLTTHGWYGALALLTADIFKRGKIKSVSHPLSFSNCILKPNPCVNKLTFEPVILSKHHTNFLSITSLHLCIEIVSKE